MGYLNSQRSHKNSNINVREDGGGCYKVDQMSVG